MYQATVRNSIALQQCIAIMNCHTNNINLHFNNQELMMISINGDQSTLLEIKIPLKVTQRSKNHCVGVQLSSLQKTLRMTKAEEQIEFVLNENKPDLIQIRFNRTGEQYKQIELHTLELQQECMIPANNEYQHAINIEATILPQIAKLRKQLKRLEIEQSQQNSDIGFDESMYVEIETQEEVLHLNINAINCKGIVTVKRKQNEKQNEKNQFKNKYNINHLSLLPEDQSLNKEVTLSWAKETILRIEYKFDVIGYLRYYVAPLNM